MSQTIDVEATTAPTEGGQPPTMALQARPVQAVGKALTLNELHERLEFVRQVMKQEMREGQDFGKIPGTGDKPSLLQPGAQKLLMTFNLREQIKKETMRELPHPSIFGHREYETTISVFPAGLGPEQGWDGVGTCSTFESKYRYRKAERKCPDCGKSAIIVGKAEYGGGFVCFKKKGGCGAKFHDGHPAIVSQSTEDIENEDPSDCWNTVRKMAFKRALVAAAINATNTSELWTQDVEDMAENRGSGLGKSSANAPRSDSGSHPTTKTPPSQSKPQAQRRVNTPPPSQASTPPNSAPPPARTVQEAIFADEETRKRMIFALSEQTDLAIEYFQKLTNPTLLLPNEGLEDVPLRYVPVTRNQMKALQAKIADFGNGGEATHPYPANPEPPAKGQRKAPTSAKTPDPKPSPSVEAAAAKDPEWFWDVMITVPPKGSKKAEYDRDPDTIRSLYQAMKDGDDNAQKRLWGLAKHWDCQPREYNGKTYPPSDADKVCRQALDAFVEFENHRGKQEEAQSELSDAQEDSNAPF